MDEEAATRLQVQRREIIRRYARLKTNGKVTYCEPSKAELSGEIPRRETSGSDSKVIYPDLESAEAAAREMTELLGDAPQRAYLCQRSRHGHAHLTRFSWGAKGRKSANG